MKYRGSRDKNHDDIAHVFLGLGCSVADMALAGVPNFPDMVVGLLGTNVLVEVKNPETAYGKQGLNTGQTAFARDWRGGSVHVVTTASDAIALVQTIRALERARLT